MSILIKALKQAERDHLARAAAPAMASTAVAEPEPAPVMVAIPASLPPARNSPALSLEPVDDHDGGADARTDTADPFASGPVHGEAPDETLADDAMVAPADAATDVASPAPAPPPMASSAAPRVVAAVLPTTQDPAAALRAGPNTRAPAAIPRLEELARPAAPAGKVPARPPEVQGRPRAHTTPDASAEASASGDALQSDERKAARQLMAPAPGSGRLRRMALLACIAVVLAGGVAAAAWLGLFSGLDGLFSASMPPAPSHRTLADRLVAAPGAAGATADTHDPVRGSGPVPAPSAKSANRTINAAARGTLVPAPAYAPPPPMAGAPASADSHANALAPRAADVIHLRPPEATPERLRALLQEAYAAAGRGDTAGAAGIYQQVIDLDHNNGDAWIGLAALAANGGDGATANRDYRRALEIDPGDSVALGGLLGLQTGVDAQEAETRLRLLIVHDGAQPALQAALGKMLARQGRWLEAQETFYQAWAADPTQPDVAFNLAVTLERIRQPLPALSFYRRALELSQTHSTRFNPAVAQERIAALTPKQP